MQQYINLLSTHFPGVDPPYDVYYQQVFEQVELAEERLFAREVMPAFR